MLELKSLRLVRAVLCLELQIFLMAFKGSLGSSYNLPPPRTSAEANYPCPLFDEPKDYLRRRLNHSK